MKPWQIQSISYILVGVFNTIFGQGIIFGLLFLGIMPELANFIGYVLGILVSFLLNNHFTFKATKQRKLSFIRFVIALLIAYVAQLLALIVLYRAFDCNVYIAQILASCVYVALGFGISKFYAFRAR